MPLRRTTATVLYARSLSKAAKPSSPSTMPPSSPLRSPSLAEVVPSFTPTPLEHLRRSKKVTGLSAKSSKTKKHYSLSSSLSPRTSLDIALDDDKASHPDEVWEQDLNDFPIVLGRGSMLDERARPEDRPQVQLADLLIVKKSRRKGRGNLLLYSGPLLSHAEPTHVSIDGDFEVIPPIRSVIVLDDDTTPDLDFDEPWEHIYGVEDVSTTHEPSYAKIASLN